MFTFRSDVAIADEHFFPGEEVQTRISTRFHPKPQLVVHLGVDVLQRGQSRTSRVTVVPAHQGQPPHEQVLTDLEQSPHDRGLEKKTSF
ncbi:hypothetical protein EYF80_020518 [Liparis tanakae]|uniref:Uncharacterized protein n=1 Tax=Liparis tanakae TaxID=230148 RepID=A0A4Z2HUI1_9TELE|nr:hypothetical protein EYF80_020518 [Liparis tanakae]